MRPQPTLGPDEKEVLRNKILMAKQYIAPSIKRIKSLIKYFSVTAIKESSPELNHSILAPSFSLLMLNVLLRTTDLESLMEDRDIGEIL
jgi:hypothetical protein